MMKNILLIAATAGILITGIATADEIYSTDFEANDGGWVASADWDPVGDWEWGEYDFGLYTGSYNPPPAANSGTHLWGTVLHGDYTNSGGDNFLIQTFDFSAYAEVEMQWANWAEVFYNFDTAELFVNDVLVYERVTNDAPVDWETKIVDLTDFAGLSDVEIKFKMHATTVVERAGWYVDDILLTGVLDRPCLDLQIQNFVAGEQAVFTVSAGTPGAKVVTVFGTKLGEVIINGFAGYCSTFGIAGVNQNRVLGGFNRTFDGNGVMTFGVQIPNNTSGIRVHFQSSENGTCPEECMSEVITQVVG